MTENQKQGSNSDEIDLGMFFSKIGDFFKNMGLGFLRFLALLRRIPLENKTIFILLIFAGLAGGLSFPVIIKRFFSSNMILSSAYLNKRIIDNTIEKLNLLADEDDKTGLAKALNISDSTAKNIYDFSVKPFVDEDEIIKLEVLKEQLRNSLTDKKNADVIDQVIERIGIENRHSFVITIRVYKSTTIKEIQTALVNYLKNNEYVKKRIEITQINLQARKQKLLKESQKLDSLKSVIYANYQSMAAQSRQGSNNVILSDKAVTNPIEIFDQDFDFYNEIESIDRSLYLQDDLEVIDGFTEFSEPTSAGHGKASAVGILIAIGLGYLLVGLMSFNKYLSKLA